MLLALGCSAVVDPDENLLGGGDDGPMLMDAGLGTDATPGVDVVVPPRDTGDGCTGAPRCEGDVAVRCEGGAEVREACADGARCVAGSCEVMPGCDPGEPPRCAGNQSIVCVDGTEQATDCPDGCDSDSGQCRPPPDPCADAEPIGIGDDDVTNLCSEADSNTFQPQSDCHEGTTANLGDKVYRLEIERRTGIVINLRDWDEDAAIDTVVYLRNTCDDVGSQLACADDIECFMSSIMSGCSGGFQVRESRITTVLDPGTYYIVVDGFMYGSFECGDVLLSIRSTGISGGGP